MFGFAYKLVWRKFIGYDAEVNKRAEYVGKITRKEEIGPTRNVSNLQGQIAL